MSKELAEFQLGDRVKVVERADEVMEERYMNQEGIVVGLNIKHDCGYSEDWFDPMWLLQFPNGERDAFWTEELEPV